MKKHIKISYISTIYINMLKKLTQFYYFYETDIVKNSTDSLNYTSNIVEID